MFVINLSKWLLPVIVAFYHPAKLTNLPEYPKHTVSKCNILPPSINLANV